MTDESTLIDRLMPLAKAFRIVQRMIDNDFAWRDSQEILALTVVMKKAREGFSSDYIFKPDPQSGVIHPCMKCGSTELGVKHCFGAKVVCKTCRHEGPFVDGEKFEDEEKDAVLAWNEAR